MLRQAQHARFILYFNNRCDLWIGKGAIMCQECNVKKACFLARRADWVVQEQHYCWHQERRGSRPQT